MLRLDVLFPAQSTVLAILATLAGVLWPGHASAIVGGAATAPDALASTLVMVVGSRGNFCSGTVIAPDLVLTAAHCALPGSEYKLFEYDAKRQPSLRDVAEIARHPKFDLQALLGHRATADMALLRLALALPDRYTSAVFPGSAPSPSPNDAFVIAGYGVAVRGDGRTGGTARAATLVATGRPGTLQLRLVDPATRNEKPGLGACTGDSGAPVFIPESSPPTLIGLVSWSTAANNAAGCGGLTGVTPLASRTEWIVEAARRMGVRLRQ